MFTTPSRLATESVRLVDLTLSKPLVDGKTFMLSNREIMSSVTVGSEVMQSSCKPSCEDVCRQTVLSTLPASSTFRNQLTWLESTATGSNSRSYASTNCIYQSYSCISTLTAASGKIAADTVP